MIFRYFETDKKEVYGNNEKLIFTRDLGSSVAPIPPVGSLVMLQEIAYRVIDLCFESDFNKVDIMMTLDEE